MSDGKHKPPKATDPLIATLPSVTKLKLKDAFRKRDLQTVNEIIDQLTRIPS